MKKIPEYLLVKVDNKSVGEVLRFLDAEEVERFRQSGEKRGRWKRTKTGWVYCTACGNEPPNESNETTPYCPWCGAYMMDGDGNEID